MGIEPHFDLWNYFFRVWLAIAALSPGAAQSNHFRDPAHHGLLDPM
jgi:hypothetical protein